jgi:hypothetical protein
LSLDAPGKQINTLSMSPHAHIPRQWAFILALLLAVAGAAACGSSAPSHPDTGYGANQPVPSTVNCTDLCTRGADCGGQLCDEDTMSTNYTALVPILIAECESAACNASVLAQLTTADWQCYFQSSCRQVYEQNVCHVANTSYRCN